MTEYEDLAASALRLRAAEACGRPDALAESALLRRERNRIADRYDEQAFSVVVRFPQTSSTELRDLADELVRGAESVPGRAAARGR